MDCIAPAVYRNVDLPRAFPNPGHWCWFNAVLQALASIHDPRPDLHGLKISAEVLACLASVLLYLNHDLDDGLPEVAGSRCGWVSGPWLREECGISSIYGEQQDAHEALVKLLEAVEMGLSTGDSQPPGRGGPQGTAGGGKRKLAAFQRLRPWDPMRPYWLGSRGFLRFCDWARRRYCSKDLFEGVLEETRVCTTCGLVRVESCPSKQAFRCLSLDLIQMDRPHFSRDAPRSLVNLLGSAFSGKATEEIDGLLCDRCSLEASLRALVTAGRTARPMLGSGDSIFAVRACHRFATLLHGRLPDAEGLEALRSVGAPPCVLKRRLHRRAFRIKVAPAILTFHMRRLIFGPFGLFKVSNPVRYPEILDHRDSLGLGGGYALSSVMSHLGHATEGHFVTHRVWQRGTPIFEGDGVTPVLLEGKVHRWFALDASLRFLRGKEEHTVGVFSVFNGYGSSS
eukprot:Skav213520  [mRNA]  locus=scaffold656:169229:186189:+ [translate_table: standard]